MKIIYKTIITILLTQWSFAQNISFEIVKNAKQNYSIIALASSDMPNKFVVSDIGLTIVLPNDGTEIINLSPFHGRSWSKLKIDHSIMSRYDMDIPYQNLIVINLPPTDTSEIVFEDGKIELLNFDLTAPLTTGTISIVDNKKVTTTVVGNSLNSFINAKMEQTDIKDYFLTKQLGNLNGAASVLEYRLYPNPVKEVVYLTGELEELEQIDVFNTIGQLIKQIKSNFSEINISELKTGLYLVRLHDKNKDVTSKRMIKQ